MQWHKEAAPKDWPVIARLSHQAIGQAPENPRNWIVHAQALARQGLLADAASVLREAEPRFPNDLTLRQVLISVLIDGGEIESALAEAEACLRQSPDSAAMQVARFELLVKTRQMDAAAAHLPVIERIGANNRFLLEVKAYQARRHGRVQELRDVCEGILAREPGHGNATYFLALALASLHELDRARSIMSTTRFVDICDLVTPPVYASAEAFRAALAEEIKRNPTLIRDRRGKASRGGLRTHRLRQPDAPATEALIAGIKQAVEGYEQRLAGVADGFAAARPQTARIDAWAIIFGAEGHQLSHRHPGAWLSGVFYVSAPRAPGENNYRGTLQLGAVDAGEGFAEAAWETRPIEPIPGRLIMFPSYLPHATEPTGVDGDRICVAFDVIPADKSPPEARPPS